ncbi:M4 family metallopeptidase [Maribacter halichondriae]|uniref:M4 family metallopeptidase n=1 Tax=Maribacter halichondriae TaxID=2980554 RepID=UPI002359ADF8|nr:M4 family metallopeptidase [Maribacter sp. Hal144]
MKRTLLINLAIGCFLGMVSLSAQDTFDDKRHPNTGTVKSTAVPKFNTKVLNIKREKSITAKSGRTQFQMPSVFNLSASPSLYTHKIVSKSEAGLPLFIESKAKAETAKLVQRQSLEAITSDYLMDVKGLLRINDPSSEFKVIANTKDKLGQTHIKMQQVFKGVKVYGSEVILHLDKKQQVRGLNGRNRPTPIFENTTPKLSVANALAVIENDLGKKLPKATAAKNNSPLNLPELEEELLIYHFEGKDALARHLTVYPNIMDRWEYFIDAQTGKILDKYYHTCTFHFNLNKEDKHYKTTTVPPENGNGNDLNGVNRQLNTYSVNGTNYMVDTSKPMFNAAQSELPDNPVGAIMTLDLRNEAPEEGVEIFHVTSNSNTWNNATGVSAHYNADVSYEYFRNTFNRNSINGQGGTIISFINVADPEDGGSLENAFWNGKAMFYGNGRVAFEPFAGALDVGGHEMSHGVIQNTANLEYRYQSGAINESYADIFGVMIDRDDWQLAEDIVNTQYFPSGAMRDMQNPNNGRTQLGENGWQPKDMTEYYTGDQDNGGVHINSGIPNRAFYLVATDIGKEKAEQIYYRALDNYLTVSSQFIDLRLAIIRSATDLHGENSLEVTAVMNAFDTVGITDGAPTDTDNDIPTASGDEFILSADVNANDPNTLYISDTQGQNFVPMSTTGIFRKPSVADDGSLTIFVTDNNTVNAVVLDPNNPEESVLSEEQIWAAVSLSKDGSKLASVRNDQSNIIYISDLVSGDSRAYELYNPTSADGVTTGEVLYPDALEWDYSGQYLIYDALNRLQNGTGQDIEYWDVGALKVWDNQSNTFGDGNIQKIFSNLPEGVSIGNPSFSKTSGNILAFDYFDSVNNEYRVFTANIETGENTIVYQNNKLGFPNFSKNDDKLIFDSTNNGSEVIAVIDLANDKMSPSGNATELIVDAQWGIWYTVGERSTLSNEKEITDFRFNVTDPASIGVISGSEINVSIPGNINPAALVATFSHSANATVTVGNTVQQSGVNANDFTNPVVYTVTAEDSSMKSFTVTLGGGSEPDPNDTDNDGVPNDSDQCPNTPLGTVVDVTGCEIFSLPSDNFRVRSKGESCADSNNGSITVEAAANYNYTANITGNGLNESVNFTQSVLAENLEAGTYTICITVQGQTGYENCFDVTVVEPEALSVASKVDTTGKTVTLQLSGGESYSISMNDEILTTTESEVTVSLKSSSTKLIVKTDKDCQGVYEEIIDLTDKIVIYPNPIKNGEITIELASTSEQPMKIQLNSFDGRAVLQKTVEPNTTTIQLDADSLTSGVYMLSVQIDRRIETYKIVKQ